MSTVEEQKKQVIDLLEQNYTIQEISEIVFDAKKSVLANKFISDNNIDVSKYGNRYKFKDEQWLRDQYENQGKTAREISKEFGMSNTSVLRYLEKFGIRKPSFNRKARNNVNKNYFKDIDTREKAYFLGLAMTDGCVYNYNNTLGFELKLKSTDDDIVLKLAKAIGFEQDKIRYDQGIRNGVVNKYVQLRTYNKDFVNNLMNKGIVPQKSGKEFIPFDVIPKEYICDFIRGAFDGDGCLSTNNYSISFCSFSTQMLIDMKKILEELNVRSSELNKEENKIGQIRLKNADLITFLDKVYYRGCLSMNRKSNAANIIYAHRVKVEKKYI